MSFDREINLFIEHIVVERGLARRTAVSYRSDLRNAAEVVKHLAPLKCGVSFKADAAATPEFVRELRDAGLRVVCWGVFDDELGIKMAEIGVDALTSNHAVALRGKYLETHRG